LTSLGAEAAHLPWKDTSLEVFAAADAVLPLCCWDYHGDPRQFARWIEGLEGRGVKVMNSARALRWNLRKTYLLEMAAAGLTVPKTVYLPEATRQAVESRMEQEGWEVAVLKPVSGQSGYGVRRLPWAERAGWALDGTTSGEALLQQYQGDVASLGETTLTFIDGTFSHAVRRILRPGEWRANQQYGTTIERMDPSPAVVQAARSYLDILPEIPLYARVDGLVRPGGFMLMELELIEPYLYLEFAPGSAERLARALLRRLN
jgi:glutathione synthase/RimK-type ligase-like ATP-grasp enzyme